jgi:hypothetical protein
MKKVFTIALLLWLALPGCGAGVKKTVSSRFALFNPYTVAILPVEFTETEAGGDGDINALFRKMTFERLERMNYGPLEPAEVDRRLEAPGEPHGDTAGRDPKETARLMGSDAVLYTTITEWKSDIVVRYAYLKVNAVFELYSKDGTLLWKATHDLKESDIRLEKMALELAVIKAYEPSVQRFINIVFSTLPASAGRSEEKTFFKWLP